MSDAILSDAAYIKSALEAMLFASGEAVEISRLARAVGITEDNAALYLNELSADYSTKGIQIIRLENKYQMRTNPAYFLCVKSLMNLPDKKVLTGALLETLAIVAYKQPVTRSQIEDIRGLNADHAVNRLSELGLIREAGRLDAPGKPVIFVTTDEFLRRFGIESLDDLPEELQDLEEGEPS